MSIRCCRCILPRKIKLNLWSCSQPHQRSGSTEATQDTFATVKNDGENLIEKAKLKLHSRSAAQKKPTTNITSQKLSDKSREMAVPSSRISRMMNYGALAAGIGLGTLNEIVKKQLGLSSGDSTLLSESNVERIVTTLCKVRGAALKIGQMMSIQDNSFIPEDVQSMFERVRANADFMPQWQMEKVLSSELGSNWRGLFKEFDMRPFAAASIGQVHHGVTLDDIPVAVKVQYPGVAESIDNDVDTLLTILLVSKILPEGLFLQEAATVARKELSLEVDYLREADCSARFKKLLQGHHEYFVADYFPELTTKRILTTELIQGIPLDVVQDLDQDTRNKVSLYILKLCLKELLEFNFMQTDPNWSNFFYNKGTDQICLLDFGASREYARTFVDSYIKVLHGASQGDRETVNDGLCQLGFQTGYESKAFIKANVDAVMILGEPFSSNKEYDFSSQDITQKIKNLIPVMMRHRLSPPPEETYSLHRKMSGAYLLCTKLGAKINCYNLFHDQWNSYTFEVK